MTETKFYICKHCGNIIGVIEGSGVPVVCCGEKMQPLVANTVEASKEKHLPVVVTGGDKVTVRVGAVTHPATAEHHISWIYLQTESGGQRKSIPVGEEPSVSFALCADKPKRVYAYCNLHGLWMTEL